MTDRDALHVLVDALPDDAIPAVAAALRGAAAHGALAPETEDRIRRGIADADRGALTPAAEVFRAMRERLDTIEHRRG